MLLIEVLILAFNQIDFLFYLVELFKAFVVLIFVEIVLKSAGFDRIEGKRFSQAQVESILIRKSEFKVFFGKIFMKNKQEVNWFLLKVRIALIQFCVISFAEVILASFLKFYMDDYLKFGEVSFSSGFFWLIVLKFFSFSLLFYYFFLFIQVFQEVSEDFLNNFKRISNFLACFLIFSEFQVIVNSLLMSFTEIFGKGVENETVKLVNTFYSMIVIIILVRTRGMFKYPQKITNMKSSDCSNTITEISSTR
jgi:hypothetical protein